FDGTRIESSGDLPPLVGRIAPDSEVRATLVRRGDKQTRKVTVGRLPEDQPEVAQRSAAPRPDADPLGLVVEPVDKDVQGDEAGVRVQDVAEESPAAEAGLRPGDIITQLGYDEIDSVASYRDAVGQLPEDEPVAVRFVRDGQPSFRTLRPRARE